MKRNFLIFFSLLCFSSSAQLAWERVDSEPYHFTDAIHIDQKGNFFMGIRGRFNVLWSSDQGEHWTDVTSEQELYLDEKAFFELEPGSVYYSNAQFTTAQFSKWDGFRFRAFDHHKFVGSYSNLIFGKSGNVFLRNSRKLYKLQSDMSFDSTLKIAEFKDLILNFSFFYNDSSNYVITSTTNPGNNDVATIFKLNVLTGDTLRLAQWPSGLRKSNIQITEEGHILIASSIDGLLYSEPNDPASFTKIELDTSTPVFSVLSIGRTTQGQLFVITSNGLYINYGPGFHRWTKCHSISQGMPIEGFMQVHDSVTAMNLETEECFRRNCVYFNARSRSWNKVDIENAVYSFSNLGMSGAGVMYGRMDCHYYQSHDTGKTWSILLIQAAPVVLLTINHRGQAVAIADGKLYVFDDAKKVWMSSLTTLASNTGIMWLNFYRVGSQLFLEGFDHVSATVYKHYRLHSDDGGVNWRTTTPFDLRGLLSQGIQEIKIADSTEWLGLHKLKDSIMVSYDRGVVWSTNTIFSQFRAIGRLFKLPDGSYLIQASYNKMGGLYHVSKTGEILKELSNFRRMSFIQYFPPDQLMAYNYFNPGFVFSNNFGEDIEIINQGIPNQHPDKINYLDLLYHNHSVYYSNASDGIYILKNPFGLTDVKNTNHTVDNLGDVYVQRRRVIIRANIDQYRSMNYRIMNNLGVIIANGSIEEETFRYEMSGCPAGIYLVSIFADGAVQTRKLFIE